MSENQSEEILYLNLSDYYNLDLNAAEDPLPCHWVNWCRLCAKDDKQHNINILLQNHINSSDEGKKLNLPEALEKYFGVQISSGDTLPKMLCASCSSLVSAMVNFSKHVEHVQLMFSFLNDMRNLSNSFDLNSVRPKFNVTETERNHCLDRFHSINDVNKINNHSKMNERPEHSSSDGIHGTQIKEVNVESVAMDCDKHMEIEADEKEELGLDARLNYSLPDEEDNLERVKEGRKLAIINVEKIYLPVQNKEKLAMESNKLDKNDKKIGEQFDSSNCLKKKSAGKDIQMECSCKECGKKFSSYLIYRKHMQQEHKHSKSKKYWPCPSCDDISLDIYNLERHTRLHMTNEIKEKVFECPKCDKRYTINASLKQHLSYKHKNEKRFLCEKCGLGVATSSHFRQHLRIHNDFAPFECQVCKKKFKDKARLKAHADIHSPKKHECKICGLQLNSRSTFNHHLLVHSDEVRHKCDYCGKGFKRTNGLKNHLLLHTGLMLFSCNFCEKSYGNRTFCRRHMKKMHPEELAILDASGEKTYTQNIPKLETLKAVTKSGDNLKPVVGGRGAKKQKAKCKSGRQKSADKPKISDSYECINEQLPFGTNPSTPLNFYHDLS